jgi:hypothetical protein
MDVRTNSLQDLFDRLKSRMALSGKISLENNFLTITNGAHYIIKVKLIYGKGFVTYINDDFFDNIEEQDIVDVLIDISENDYYVIEKYQTGFFRRDKFEFLTSEEFAHRKNKLLKAPRIKIFNHNKIVYQTKVE